MLDTQNFILRISRFAIEYPLNGVTHSNDRYFTVTRFSPDRSKGCEVSFKKVGPKGVVTFRHFTVLPRHEETLKVVDPVFPVVAKELMPLLKARFPETKFYNAVFRGGMVEND